MIRNTWPVLIWDSAGRDLMFSMQWTAAWNVSRSISSVFRQPFTDRTNSDQGGLLEYMLDHTWTPENPNPNAEYPRATFINDTNNYAESTLWEKDAKYLRLKNLQIAYNFNLPFMKKLKLNTMQLALSGYNLLTFTPYFWSDPESKASQFSLLSADKNIFIEFETWFLILINAIK